MSAPFFMNFSNKTKSLSSSPQKLSTKRFTHNLSCTLVKLNIRLDISFDTKQDDEIIVYNLYYDTSYRGEYLGVIDAFFELAENKPVEAIDRLGIKELDYFLRDQNSIPSFSFYSQELYEILSIGEEIKSLVIPKSKSEKLLFDFNNESFFDLSFSEQAELLEEIFAMELYPYKEFEDIEIEYLDCENEKIILSIDPNPAGEVLKSVQLAIQKHTDLESKLKLSDS